MTGMRGGEEKEIRSIEPPEERGGCHAGRGSRGHKVILKSVLSVFQACTE